MAHGNKSQSLEQVQCELNEGSQMPFGDLLPTEKIEEEMAALGVAQRGRIYTQKVTLWMFLSQVLSADHSCREAVARRIAWLKACGEKACSAETTSYCAARMRLPLELIQRLMRSAGREAPQTQPAWLWKGRHVKPVDGTTLTMPDTKENQAKFPRRRNQKHGVGFPILRMVVVFSLAYGTALELAMGPMRGKKTGENELFRSMLDLFEAGDIMLGDRLFGSYRDIASLRARGVDVVCRMHQSRHCDFRRGRWLATYDHLVTWKRPTFDSKRFDRKTYDALPEEMEVREIRYRVAQAGFRTREVAVVTTLLDAELYPKEELAELYRQRWHSELDLNALKTTLQMKHLRCQSPEMVEKEVWTHFLAYNLMRQTMAQTAAAHDVLPRELSFKGAVQTVNSFALFLAMQPDSRDELWEALLTAIATHVVGDRPNRVEPRKVKYRQGNTYPRLKKPRTRYREASCA